MSQLLPSVWLRWWCVLKNETVCLSSVCFSLIFILHLASSGGGEGRGAVIHSEVPVRLEINSCVRGGRRTAEIFPLTGWWSETLSLFFSSWCFQVHNGVSFYRREVKGCCAAPADASAADRWVWSVFLFCFFNLRCVLGVRAVQQTQGPFITRWLITRRLNILITFCQ